MFNLFFFVFFRFYSSSKMMGRIRLGSDVKNGPKQRVLHRLGHRYVVFFSFMFYLSFFVLFRFYLCSKTTGRVGLGGDEKNGPKQCKMHCLGHRYVPFLLLMFFTVCTNYLL